MIRLVSLKCVGSHHRAGWPWIRRCLDKELSSKHGILVDDFVERTFLYGGLSPSFYYSQPWLGFFHHPPDIPLWWGSGYLLENLFKLDSFRRSLSQLKGAVCLSPNVERFLRQNLPSIIPIKLLKHPSFEVPKDLHWNKSDYKGSVSEVGWFLRNPLSVYIGDNGRFPKYKVCPKDPWVTRIKGKASFFYNRALTIEEERSVEWLPFLSNDDFDSHLRSTVVYLDFVATAASNTIIECIERRTPLIVTKNEANLFYLGKGYPLFKSESGLDLIDFQKYCSNASAAHSYLSELGSDLSISTFLTEFRGFLQCL